MYSSVMYPGQVPRTAPAAVRTLLVERAAEMLARREPVSLRSLVSGTGVSTMAVYTHFDGMPGLWRAVRQEGFVRLAGELAGVPRSDDPVRDLAALGAAYQRNATAHPDLYRAMFDAAYDLEDPSVAAAGFDVLVDGVAGARAQGRFAPGTDDRRVATRFWASGHGLTMLRIGEVLDPETYRAESEAVAVALFVDAGDDPDRCRTSVALGYATEVP